MSYKNEFSAESVLFSFLLKFLRINWLIIFCLLFLGFIGVISLYSAAGGSWDPWAKNHFIRLIFGCILLFGVALTPTYLLKKMSVLAFFLCLLTLILVKFFGSGDVPRWISVGGINFQPSEFMKLGLILILARYFEYLPIIRIGNLFPYIIPLFLILIPGFLVISQPDLGTGLTIILLGLAILFFVGISIKFVIICSVLLVSSVPIIWQQLYEYQKNRILVFLNPEIDKLGSGYQIIQSKIAIGSGGVFGKGYLLGSQSKLNYLPEKHTDFILPDFRGIWLFRFNVYCFYFLFINWFNFKNFI